MVCLHKAKPLRHCTPSDLVNRSEERAVRLSQAQRKYSVGLLEEAFKLSEKIGLSKAAAQSEVNINSLKHYRTIRLRELGRSRVRPHIKVTEEQKERVFSIYKKLLAAKFGGSRKCWIEAGNRVGVSGRTVEFQYTRGLWIP